MVRLFSLLTLNSSLLTLFLCLLCSCNGIMSDIYDSPDDVSTGDIIFGFNGSPDATRYILKLNATGFSQWIYVDLHNKALTVKGIPDTLSLSGEWDGKTRWELDSVRGAKYMFKRDIPVATQEDAERWDFAIHHFDVRTNNGAVYETPYSSIDDAMANADAIKAAAYTPDEWMPHQCIADLTYMMSWNIWHISSYVNPVMTRWVTMDFSTPPPKYAVTNRVYAMRMSDGTYAALFLDKYYDTNGQKGILTIDVKYPF